MVLIHSVNFTPIRAEFNLRCHSNHCHDSSDGSVCSSQLNSPNVNHTFGLVESLPEGPTLLRDSLLIQQSGLLMSLKLYKFQKFLKPFNRFNVSSNVESIVLTALVAIQ